MLLSKYMVPVSKKLRFMNEQEASGLISSLETEKPMSKIPLVVFLLFWRYKVNENINNFLLAEDQFIPKDHLRQHEFTCGACGAITKSKERKQTFKETGDSQNIYENELQQLTKYLILTIVFMCNGAQWEKFNICFRRVFC